MSLRITSSQNPRIKSLLALEKPRERKKQQVFINSSCSRNINSTISGIDIEAIKKLINEEISRLK
jgi:flagellar motor component MotA